MSIEVRIPKEITEYKEKIIFGLSVRQLICFLIAIVIGGLSYWLLISKAKLDTRNVGYIVMLLVSPILAVGFIRKDGIPFEKYFALMLRHVLGTHKFPYSTNLLIDQIKDDEEKKGDKYAWVFKKGIGTNNASDGCSNGNKIERSGNTVRAKWFKTKGEKEANRRECEVFTVTKARSKGARKAAIRKAKAARQEYRTAEQGFAKIAEERSGA